MSSTNSFSLNNPPPATDKDAVGRFVWECFSLSVDEKKRLGLMTRWKENYRLYRGDHWGNVKTRSNRNQITVNLFFANIMRTVANITAKNPTIEVEDLDGASDQADKAITQQLRKWWFESGQQEIIAQSALNNEIYGITFEKVSWDYTKKDPVASVLDPYCAFPAPGVFKDVNEMPYFCHAYLMSVDNIETFFNVKDVSADDYSDLLGKDRETTRPGATEAASDDSMIVKADSGVVNAGVSGKGKALVVEMWYRDQSNNKLYPDGVRVTTVVNQGKIVLSDTCNPNINKELIPDVKTTYSWGRYPFYKTNSYEDSTSIWGFSAAEQTGNLNKKIDEIFSRLLAYVQRSLLPPLIVQKGLGISKSMINNQPGLILQPIRDGRIEFLRVPDLPRSFFEVLDRIISVHDRVYQIEDADRGVQPQGVTAASAIVALQERNSVLIQQKIRAIDKLAKQRGRWAMSFFQNFGVQDVAIVIDGEPIVFKGVELAGRKFNYIVESGSTVARTTLYKEEQASKLYEMGVVDREYVLETLNVQDWRRVLERAGEGQLDQALQILVQAGLPQEEAIELRQLLLQPQTGMGGSNPSTGGPGVPKSRQGAS